MRINKTLIQPVLTEKAMDLFSKEGKYTFKVDLWSTKKSVKKAVEDTFGVEVGAIKTAVVAGKRKRINKTPRFTTTNMYKKAILSLKKGKLDFYQKS